MTKLIDADKLKGYLDQIHEIWAADPADSDITFVLKSIIGTVASGRFDAADELQPVEPRQTLMEALRDAPVGTKFWHADSVLKGQDSPIVVAPGKMYFSHQVTDIAEHYKYHAFYADEFVIEHPTY